MKLKAITLEDSLHKKVITETKKDIGLLLLDIDGYYYYVPNDGGGTFSSNHLRGIADLLDKVNAPFDKKLKKFFKKDKKVVGGKVRVVNAGHTYTTYNDMFEELGFKNPQERKSITDFYWFEEDLKKVEFTIFNIGTHINQKIKVYAIRDNEGNEFLFRKKGLKFL